jgi:serine/threonine protein kinase
MKMEGGFHSVYQAEKFNNRGDVKGIVVIKLFPRDSEAYAHEMAMYDHIAENDLEDEAGKYIAKRLDWGSADDDDCEFNDEPVNMIVYERGKFSLDQWVSSANHTAYEIADMAAQLCAALNFFHDVLNMVHTDIKPGNIMVFMDDLGMKKTVKLIDFDGWVFIGDDMRRTHSYEYTAPEVCEWLLRANDDEMLIADPMMDVWSFGMVVLRMFQSHKLKSCLKPGDDKAKLKEIAGMRYLTRLKHNIESLPAKRLINYTCCDPAARAASSKSMKYLLNQSFINPHGTSNTTASVSQNELKELKDMMKENAALTSEMRQNLNTALKRNDPAVLDMILKEVKDVRSDVGEKISGVGAMLKSEIAKGNEEIKGVFASHMNDIKATMMANVNELAAKIDDATDMLKQEIAESTGECFERFEDSLAAAEERLMENSGDANEAIMVAMSSLSDEIRGIELTGGSDGADPGMLSSLTDMMAKMSENIDDLKTKGAVQSHNGAALKGISELSGVLSMELGKSDERMREMLERIEERVGGLADKVEAVAESQESLECGIESMADNMNSMSSDMKDVIMNQEEMKSKLSNIEDKVDALHTVTLDIAGKFSIPRIALMVPDDLSGSGGGEEKKKKKKGMFGKMKSKMSKKVKKVNAKLGLSSYYRLVLCCEGTGTPHGDVPCCDVHNGYSIKAPGPTLKKMAPLLILTSKMLSVASVAGRCAGLPLPSCIPGVGALSGLGAQFSELIDSDLGGGAAKAFRGAYGEKFREDKVRSGEDPDESPTVGDMLEMFSDDMSEKSARFKEGVDSASIDEAREETKALLGSAYEAMEAMLLKDTTWEADKADFFIQRYTVGGSIKWLCPAHAKANKAEPFKGAC